MSNEQKVDLSKMTEFQREVYKNFGILPAAMEVVDNKFKLSDEELFQEEIARRQKEKYPSDEKTEEELLELKAANLIFEQFWRTSFIPKIEELDIYLSNEEKKEKFIENTQTLQEQIASLKNKEIENIKANPEESLKKLYKINLDMKKEMAKQSLKIRFLEKEAQGLADKLAAELNKSILDRIKESVSNMLKSFKKEVKNV